MNNWSIKGDDNYDSEITIFIERGFMSPKCTCPCSLLDLTNENTKNNVSKYLYIQLETRLDDESWMMDNVESEILEETDKLAEQFIEIFKNHCFTKIMNDLLFEQATD